MVTEEEWSGEIAKAKQLRVFSALIGVGTLALISIPCSAAGRAMASGPWTYLVSAGLLLAVMVPIVFTLVMSTERRQQLTDDKVRRLNSELTEAIATADRDEETVRSLNAELSEAIAAADREAVIRDTEVQRQRFESRLANALDMAEGESEVIDVIERCFGAALPEATVELLLADNSHAHLVRMAAVGPEGEQPGCTVDSPDRCPAARRAQIQMFSDSDEVDACPKLRNRAQGRLSALCVPVSIMGRTVGVIHATNRPQIEIEDNKVNDLATLAKLSGARIGVLRVMAETQLQASTDALTGLLNRRAFSQQVGAIAPRLQPIAVAMADLDHFKMLNDTYGHETGDKALRLFAQVLRHSLRSSDLVSRYGGEEFAIAFPDCSVVDAARALNTARAQLDAAITVGGLPKFTCSFGITVAELGEELSSVLRRADDALMAAKRQGRDQVVLHDAVGSASIANEETRVESLLDDQLLQANHPRQLR